MKVDKKDLELVRASKWVNGKWYVEQYPDVGLLNMDPSEHYLMLGARLGRNPCKRFSTKYYLSANPDVKSSGINPLVHFIKYGKEEGRSPKPNNFQGYINSLWEGHSTTAIKRLKSILNNAELYSPGQRWNAAWHIARWAFFEGRIGDALKLALEMDALDGTRHLRKERVLLVASCYYLLDQASEATDMLNEYLAIVGFDADIMLCLANTLDSEVERLAMINRVFAHHNLMQLKLLDSDKPLNLHNLTSIDAVMTRKGQDHKVSVIIPAFNAAERIEVVLHSLLNQTWANLEVIIVDDCSDDETYEIAQSVAANDARVKPFKQPQNAGAYAARNRGLALASGDFITTHDSDDWSHPQKIEHQVRKLLANNELMGVSAHWVRATEQLYFTQNWRPNNELIHWSQSSFLFRKAVVEELGGWDEVRVGGDTEFIWRVEAQYGKGSVKKIYEGIPFAFALDDEGSLTRTKVTHVRTVYFGLRHIYRALCKWWHRTHDKLHVADERPFAAPVSMVDRSGDLITLDVLLVGDFADEEQSLKLLAQAKKLAEQKRVGLFHWPSFASEIFQPTDSYCEAVYEQLVTPIVFGDPVAVKDIIVINRKHVSYPLDALPDFKQLGDISLLRLDGSLSPANDLRSVFVDVERK